MRIHTDDATSFIHALAASIGKDPASLEGWYFLHVQPSRDSMGEGRAYILTQLKKSHPELDCDVVQSADHDIFLITRSLGHAQLHALADECIAAASMEEGGMVDYALYDLYRDWRGVRHLLLTHAEKPGALTSDTSWHDFSEIGLLEEIFSEAKKLRKERLPLQVMVVEDDPLTRRLVTGAFKEDYALITAANAQEAVANYLLYAPDIVFLDIGLPDASGFDVLHQIMTSDKDAYVVMLSGKSYLDNVTTALSHGAAGFVAKPFKKDKMHQYIQDSALHHHKHYA